MVRIASALTILAASLSPSRAFITPKILPAARSLSTSAIRATPPTMVIYWTIKTAIDTAMYSLGMTDSVKGTGVWNSFELNREKDEEKDDDKKEGDSQKK